MIEARWDMDVLMTYDWETSSDEERMNPTSNMKGVN
jgi:hypothetical protein